MRISKRFRDRIAVTAAALLGVAVMLTIGATHVASQSGGRGGPVASPLTPDDVTAILQAAAQAISDSPMGIAVVDRTGTILGVYGRGPRDTVTKTSVLNTAVSLARTTGYFSNDQAPLSSRTVRFISGIHFPPGIKNTSNAALYGVENINRGCDLGLEGDAIFNTGLAIDRPRTIAGSATVVGGASALPCRPDNTLGCSVGITTGKADLFDAGNRSVETYGPTINPGGIPLYRGRQLIGGIGVAGVPAERAQFAALIGAGGNGRGITTAISFPDPIPTPGAIYIDGIRLPFYGACGTFLPCIQAAIDGRPEGSSPGTFSASDVIFRASAGGRQAPEGYTIGPCNRPGIGGTGLCNSPGGLTQTDVVRIVNQAIAEADRTRAAVRLPFGQTSTFIIAVTDQNGNILAEYRMTDALFDATDVVPSKARNAYYFSTRQGYEVLRDYVRRASYDTYTWEPDPPAGQGWALTSRTISFGGQPLFPPGIDLEKPATPGPWFDLFLYDTQNVCTEGSGPDRGGNRSFINQNGITWFPGSAPLYKNGQLVGGLGVSGDGVEQNDLVTAAGATGFEPPNELRVDNSTIRDGNGAAVRLPYLKFPRNSTQR
jgi:uncharacterized protein GlcG (DUF336 family)